MKLAATDANYPAVLHVGSVTVLEDRLKQLTLLRISQMRLLTAFVAIAVAACTGDMRPSEKATEEAKMASFGAQLGSVTLVVSCSREAATEFRRGLALLHHMTYEGAADAFSASATIDPNCAMSHWGIAMTAIHPMWTDPPSAEKYAEAERQLGLARSVGTRTAVEEAFVDALGAYFAIGRIGDEKKNLAAFADGWGKAFERFPENEDIMALRSLSYLATASPADKTYGVQLEAGRIAEGVLAANDEHPGGHHYVIHAYDYPPLASRALEVARNYGKIAPEVPHALHMPSHIFTRLGLWNESIEWNRRSADAAQGHAVGGHISMHYLHALDYLAYGYLQIGQDANAAAVLTEMDGLMDPMQTHLAASYTLASVPARLALERQQWGKAANLPVRSPATYPWDESPATEAITYFARALGSARSGNAASARSEVSRMKELGDAIPASGAYWAQQVEIQRTAALAWIEFAEGRRDEALQTMLRAAEMELSTEKHPVTPGEVLPATELLGDMYLEMNLPAEAFAAYSSSLERSPNRLNSLFGAARSAELSGDNDRARTYYNMLTAITADADSGVERIEKARAYLGGI